MLALGVVLAVVAALAVVFGVFAPRRAALPKDRRRYGADLAAQAGRGGSALDGSALDASVGDLLARNGWDQPLGRALEAAGVGVSPARFVVLVAAAAVGLAGIGAMALGLLGAILALLICGIGVRLWLGLRAGRRRKVFANQLDDTLQLLAGGMRAGHSLLRAVDAVSREAESPTAEEFARIINETRLGRDLNDALEQSATRMRNEDFNWVAQAIAIHREVGGDLAGVLDEVGHTIRERGQIRRQVSALSAEGKMSAYILLALPFVVLAILLVTSREYVLRFVQAPLGYALMGAAAVMITIGALWMKKIVSFRF
jgi:tight adherence protein B